VTSPAHLIGQNSRNICGREPMKTFLRAGFDALSDKNKTYISFNFRVIPSSSFEPVVLTSAWPP